MSYTDQYDRAYDKVADAGSAITFSKTTTPQDDTTGAPGAPVTTTASGVAIRVKGDPIKYRDLGLTETEAATLFFVPGSQGTLPPLGSSGSWGAYPYIVRDVSPLDVDGLGAIAARVICSR